MDALEMQAMPAETQSKHNLKHMQIAFALLASSGDGCLWTPWMNTPLQMALAPHTHTEYNRIHALAFGGPAAMLRYQRRAF